MALLEQGLAVDGLTASARRSRSGRPARARRADRAAPRADRCPARNRCAPRCRNACPSMRSGRTRPRPSISSARHANVAVATGHGVGQVAVLPGTSRRGGDRSGPSRHRAADLSDQGARPRPAARARRARASRIGRRRVRRRLHARGTNVGASQRERRADESRDAALRAAASPCAVGNVPDAPALRRARRAARVPRCVRHPHRAPAAPVAARVRVVRGGAELHRRVRDDR